MKKIIVTLVLGLLLGGCGVTTAKPADQKLQENVVTRTGTIKAKVGEEYVLATKEGLVNITSNKMKLDDYMKKPITVTGMFSGSTLYVDEIKE